MWKFIKSIKISWRKLSCSGLNHTLFHRTRRWFEPNYSFCFIVLTKVLRLTDNRVLSPDQVSKSNTSITRFERIPFFGFGTRHSPPLEIFVEIYMLKSNSTNPLTPKLPKESHQQLTPATVERPTSSQHSAKKLRRAKSSPSNTFFGLREHFSLQGQIA